QRARDRREPSKTRVRRPRCSFERPQGAFRRTEGDAVSGVLARGLRALVSQVRLSAPLSWDHTVEISKLVSIPQGLGRVSISTATDEVVSLFSRRINVPPCRPAIFLLSLHCAHTALE
ncbi:MAG: hypothetical protein ACK56I_02115, partial [bacterium]